MIIDIGIYIGSAILRIMIVPGFLSDNNIWDDDDSWDDTRITG